MNDLHELDLRISDLYDGISGLPKGYISNKTINGKVRKYLQWNENGKKKSKFLDDDTAEMLSLLIENRRSMSAELKLLEAEREKYKLRHELDRNYSTTVITGQPLKEMCSRISSYRKRWCFDAVGGYLRNDDYSHVLVLYGLRRTGKTTIIRQSILAMSEHEFDRTAYIQLRSKDSFSGLNKDLMSLYKSGYEYVFIDEATAMEDFIDGAALLSDIYVPMGMKIVLSGTDSLGFMFAEDDQLYDRCILLHTTHIPYAEFEDVLGVHEIDKYIEYGGTMIPSGDKYADSTFSDAQKTDKYVDAAISRNIQHSLRNYRDGEHFRHLAELHERNELSNVISRVVEDMNHRFTLDVLNRDFVSGDLKLSAKNLRNDRHSPNSILDDINEERVTDGLKNALEILNRRERTVEIEEIHSLEIKEYLELLDITKDIVVETFPCGPTRFRTAVLQPGIRYSQAKLLVQEVSADETFQLIPPAERADVISRILSEVRGRMLEDVVLVETMIAKKDCKVFKLMFARGEFDMVISYPESMTCEIFEIKHSDTVSDEQYRHLTDDAKCRETSLRFGEITGKYVIYRGKDIVLDNGINYLNVEGYLRELFHQG